MSQSASSPSMDDDLHESAFFKRGCCCFWNFPCLKRSDSWERIVTTSDDRRREDNTLRVWWDKGLEALKKVREWSELAAGPKWKTFIRKGGRSKAGKFQYDPLSYALNFDEGQNEDDRIPRDFSSRYAAIPVLYSGQLLKEVHALT